MKYDRLLILLLLLAIVLVAGNLPNRSTTTIEDCARFLETGD